MRRRQTAAPDEGFTLIELVIVTAVLPIIVGALVAGMISVFSLNSTVSNRLTDSADAQQVSLYMQNDVQSASSITTDSSPASPGPCLPAGSTQVQILAVQLGNGDEVSYTVTQPSGDKGDDLWRNKCPAGSSTPSDSKVIAHDLPTTVTATSAFTITCTATSAACVPTGSPPVPAYRMGWVSTLGITGVTFEVTTPESHYDYKVTAVPAATANTLQPTQPAQGTTNCSFAVASSVPQGDNGQVCFVDFSPWDTNPLVQSTYTCAPPGNPNQRLLSMAEGIHNTPFTLEFCMYVSGTSGGSPITDFRTAPAACGVAQRSGWNDITAVPLPTYSCPGGDGSGSEAFLGNNGFYTGINGDPALYTVVSGSTATVQITNIQLVANNQLATGWKLVTGDAESTDSSESITWQSDQPLTLLPNSANSPIGNACNSVAPYAPPNYNNVNGLTGVGTTTVTCANSPSLNHTGTPMLQATTPSSLTGTLVGTGLQALFLGVILP